MNTSIWILQGLIAFIFIFSGICKSLFNEKTLIAKGQTGVEGFSKWTIKFIGISEIFGALALILPAALNQFPLLTPIASLCLGSIMIPAGIIHFKKNEMTNVLLNFAILLLCGIIAFYRF